MSRRPFVQSTLARDTRQSLRDLSSQPGLLARWAGASAVIALAMLAAIGLVGAHAAAKEPFVPVFADTRAGFSDVLWLVANNAMVVLLHCLVCLACYLVKRSLPGRPPTSGRVAVMVWKAEVKLALPIVGALAAGSVFWQILIVGQGLSDAAAGVGLTSWQLLARLSIHGIVEMTAMFLPLAACLYLTRRQRFEQLLAAAIITGLVALDLLIVAACWEVWGAPQLLSF